MTAPRSHVVVGGGPAGLTAAWHLARDGHATTVLERDPQRVGGLARTLEHRGFRYDVGPHRFYTKSSAVAAMWRRMLPDDFVRVERLTRIYFDQRFFPYPLAIGPTLAGIGVGRAARALLSAGAARLTPRRPERSFEDWVVNRFGRVLYETFFRTYTEKVWGVPCSQINRDWASQRIRGLSLASMLRGLVRGRRDGTGPTSLIDAFDYPRRGAGQLWEAVSDQIVRAGGRVELGADAVRLHHDGARVRRVECADGRAFDVEHVYPTMTLRAFSDALDPPPPAPVRRAAEALRHRDFVVVMLIVPRAALFPDQWIYVHDPGVRVARITNYANWSAEMSPDPGTTAIGLEYFCNRGDELWTSPDAALIALAARELATIGLGAPDARPEGRVHRELDAYPVYDDAYAEHRETLKRWIRGTFQNVHPAGRKGLHNYNSQDHAMMSATLAVRASTEGADVDPWLVNTASEYAEEGAAERGIEERLVPRPIEPSERSERRA